MILSSPDHLDVEKIKALIKEDEAAEVVEKKWTTKKGMWGKGKHENTIIFSYAGTFKEKKILDYLVSLKYSLLKWSWNRSIILNQ